MKSFASMLVGVALSFAAAGCGGSGGGNTCGVTPCGGDVVGTWVGSSACIDRALLNADIAPALKGSCPTATVAAVSLMPTGMLALAADMSYTGTLAVNTMLDINYPASCVASSTCAEVTAPLRTAVGTNGIESVNCPDTAACTCTIVQTIDIVNATGTWATSGTTLSFANAPGGDGPYCVQGSSLHMIALDATGTKIVDDIVLGKQ